MATTVTYKGETLTTVDNATKVLQTAGSWMEDDLTLVDVSGGGGNGYGGDGTWARPADMPKLDDMTISGGDIVYLTYLATEDAGFCDLKVSRSSGDITLDVGTINGGVFTSERALSYSSNQNNIRLYFGSSNGGYKVIRIAGLITNLTINRGQWAQFDSVYRFSTYQGLIEIYGELTHLTDYTSYGITTLRAVRLGTITAKFTSWFYGNTALESVDSAHWAPASGSSLQSMFDGCTNIPYIDLTKWDISTITTIQRFMYNCSADVDISKWNMSSITNTTQAFQRTRFTELTVPATLTVLSANTFSDDNQHTEYHFKATTPPAMANTNAFGSIRSQCVIYVPSAKLTDYQTASNWSTYASYMVGE